VRLRTPTDIGLAIRERRRALGLLQATLAKKVGVGRQWIIAIERGKRRAELGLILRTLEVLGIALHTGEPATQRTSEPTPASMVSIDAVVAAHRRRVGGKP
jgi:HTH-type transcriptional regulator/antitoxin HipB